MVLERFVERFANRLLFLFFSNFLELISGIFICVRMFDWIIYAVQFAIASCLSTFLQSAQQFYELIKCIASVAIFDSCRNLYNRFVVALEAN